MLYRYVVRRTFADDLTFRLKFLKEFMSPKKCFSEIRSTYKGRALELLKNIIDTMIIIILSNSINSTFFKRISFVTWKKLNFM